MSADADDPEGLARCVADLQHRTGRIPGQIHPVAGAFRFSQYDPLKRWTSKHIACRKGQRTGTSRNHGTDRLGGSGRVRRYRGPVAARAQARASRQPLIPGPEPRPPLLHSLATLVSNQPLMSRAHGVLKQTPYTVREALTETIISSNAQQRSGRQAALERGYPAAPSNLRQAMTMRQFLPRSARRVARREPAERALGISREAAPRSTDYADRREQPLVRIQPLSRRSC